MSKNDENQPLLDKDDAKTDYTAEGENAGGRCFFSYIFSSPTDFIFFPFGFI